jgi:hypothetical protein
VDAVFPKDVRASAQSAANLLILGVGMVVAGQLFPRLTAVFTTTPAVAGGLPIVDYQKLFLVPTALAILAILMLIFFFKPPSERPEATTPPPGAAH